MNEAFKVYAKANGVKLYEVAEKLSIRPQEFSVQFMRHELTAAEEAQLLDIVNAIAKEKRNESKAV